MTGNKTGKSVIDDLLRSILKKHSKMGKSGKNGSILTIEEICTTLIERGGFTGSYEDLVKYVRMFFGEMSYQIHDDLSNSGYFSVNPVEEKRARKRRPDRSIVIDIEEQTNRGYIEYFTDKGTGIVNDRVTPGYIFTVTGQKIKIEGNDPDCGVWFVSMVDNSLRYKVTKSMSENSSVKVSGIVPVIPAGKYSIEIITQYNGRGALLKKPRTIKGAFTLRNYKILTIKDEE